MSASQRRKGAAGEREFFAWLSTRIGQRVTRRLGQARDGGLDGQVGRLAIEVKRRRGIAPLRWHEQVSKAAGERVGVVMMREDRGDWFVLLRAADFLPLAEAGGLLVDPTTTEATDA